MVDMLPEVSRPKPNWLLVSRTAAVYVSSYVYDHLAGSFVCICSVEKERTRSQPDFDPSSAEAHLHAVPRLSVFNLPSTEHPSHIILLSCLPCI